MKQLDRKGLTKAAQAAKKQTLALDNAWLRGALQAVPYVGSTLDTWLFQFAEQEKRRRVEEQLEKLSTRLDEQCLDISYINGHLDEYGYLLQRALTLIAQDYRPEMREAYRVMLMKFMEKGFAPEENKELYLVYLSELSPLHLVALNKFIEALGDKERIKIQPGERRRDVINQLLEKGLESTLAESLINDLVTRGMIWHSQASVVGGDVHDYGVTELGRKMMELVQDDSTPE